MIGKAILEVLAELVLTFVCAGIGLLVVRLLGVKADLLYMDSDLLILIGVAALALCFGVAWALIHWIKKIWRKRCGDGKEDQ